MDSKKGWLERREFERVKDVLKIVYYTVDNAGGKISDSDDYRDTTVDKLMQENTRGSLISAMTQDISKGGLSITCEEPLIQGQHIIIDLYLPKIARPVKLLTEARFIQKSGNTYKAGLKTISVSKNDLKRIENHIMGLKFGQ